MIMKDDRENLPAHVAVIMDGNGRWARLKDCPRMEGHRRGAENVRSVVEGCRKRGIRHLTLYAFSTENWGRPRAEVEFLMELLGGFLSNEREEMREKGIRFRAIGRISRLPPAVREEVNVTEKVTATGEDLNLFLALNYGARSEIADACRKICEEVLSARMRPEDIDEQAIQERLYTAGVPDPDLVIRTGGEMRLSNFLLWQLSYAEIYFTEILWPEFGDEELHTALQEYARRERRFGRVKN